MNTIRRTLAPFAHPKVIAMFFLGIVAGLPLLLIFSSLSLWLREAGVARHTVTYFSWAALGYSFKFVWAPLVDGLRLPFLSGWLGKRRSWLLLAQIMVIAALVAMAMVDPASDRLALMALAAVFLGFSSATQDIVIDAYRIEAASAKLQAMLSAGYIVGYRVGMLIAGAGALFLASYFGSTAGQYNYAAWQITYLLMAVAMLVGVATTFIIDEPSASTSQPATSNQQQLRLLLLFFLGTASFVACFYYSANLASTSKAALAAVTANKVLASFVVEFLRLAVALGGTAVVCKVLISWQIVQSLQVQQTYLNPIADFFNRYGKHTAWLLLALIGLYRISDIVLGVIANVFYQDLGFSKTQIASTVKTFGLLMTICGGFLGGLLVVRFGVMRILFLGAVLSAASNLLFILLAQTGYNMQLLYLVISVDNLSAGLASVAFVAFLSSLTAVTFTAVQYAIFSSLMTLLPKVLGGYSGAIVDALGYQTFFLGTAVLGIPVLALLVLTSKRLQSNA